MNTFLSTTGSGLMRAACDANGQRSVESLLVGQVIFCLASDPLQPGTAYAGTRGAGVLRSTDYGKSWTPAGLSGYTVKALSASPTRRGVVYAGTRPACMHVSYDQGQHWEELMSFRRIFSRRFWFSPADAPYTGYVQGIALSPTDPNVIVVGIEAGAVVRSSDGGATWADHRPGALRDCHSVTFHASNGDWVYEAGGTGAGAAVSRDGGARWRQIRTGLDRHYGWACAADPQQPEINYLSISPSPFKAHSNSNAQAFIFRSNARGEWQKLAGGLPQPLDHMPYALITHPSEPGCVYAGLSNGDVWESQDLGDSWRQMPFSLHSVNRSMVALA